MGGRSSAAENNLFRKYPKIYRVRKVAITMKSHELAVRIALMMDLDVKLVKRMLRTAKDIIKSELMEGHTVAIFPDFLSIAVGMRLPKFESVEAYEAAIEHRKKRQPEKYRSGFEGKYSLHPRAFRKRLFIYTRIHDDLNQWIGEFGDDLLPDDQWKSLASKNEKRKAIIAHFTAKKKEREAQASDTHQASLPQS